MASGAEIELRAFRPERPPVLLLGGLNLVRALGLAGIPVIVATDDPAEPALGSRFASACLVLPPVENRQAVLETLARAGERIASALGCRAALFYGNDDWLNLVQEHRAELGARFSLSLNDPEVAAALIDKSRFEPFARRRGLPVPRTLQWEELEGWAGPVLVKPKVKLGFDQSALRAKLLDDTGKARIFRCGAEALGHPLAHALRGELLFQEYVGGGDRNLWSFHGYSDREGEVLAWFVGRKIRTSPALTGMSSFLELAHHEELAALARKLAARTPLKGIYKMDFKRDARTGRWVLLEVNARFNLWHYLGAANGLNLAEVAYEHLVYGARPAKTRYGSRTRWISLRLDYRAFRAAAARGELGAVRWLWSILRAPRVHDLFSWNDPVPFLRHLAGRLRRVPRLTLRLWRWLSTAS